MNVILIVCLLILGAAAQQYEGDFCRMSDGTPGTCRELSRCASVYQQLLAGKSPDTRCGWAGFSPVVCCPNGGGGGQMPTETTPPRHVWTERPTYRPTQRPTYPPTTEDYYTPEVPTGPGSIARRMCSQYAKSLYTLVIPPTLSGDRRPVNSSLCAIKSQILVVGGTKAEPKEFPHMVAIGFNRRSNGIAWSCGGTLVSERFVLTAAHCTSSLDYGAAQWVRVGDLNLRDNYDDAKPQQRRIIERIRHPSYKPPSQYHDIALLKMESPVTFDAWVRPACLPYSRTIQNTEKATATGWGRVDWTDEEGSDHLLKVNIALVSRSRCNQAFGEGSDPKLKRGVVDDWQICAGEEGKDTCQGDSGGPLVVFDQNHECMYNVIGITSLGRICGSIVPGIYTRVYNYLPWLEEKIWGF